MEKVQSVGVGWVKLDRIIMDPEVMGGQPCIRGLRISVSLIIKLIASGKKNKEILEDYPELEEEDVKQFSPVDHARGYAERCSEIRKGIPIEYLEKLWKKIDMNHIIVKKVLLKK